MRTHTFPTATADCPLIVTAASGHSVVFTAGEREYCASVNVRHHCARPPALTPDDRLIILGRGRDGDVFAAGPCGCSYLLCYVALVGTQVTSDGFKR